MSDSCKKRRFAVVFTLTFVTASIVWIDIELPNQQHAAAQSPMDMLNMMVGGGGNTTNSSAMIFGGNNISMPFNMGVMAIPMMCTTPNQMLGSLTGMFGGGGITDGGSDNATQQMMMDLMRQEMMSQVGGTENMTDSELQQVMNLVICTPMMGNEMTQGLMGSNNTNGIMSGMITQ